MKRILMVLILLFIISIDNKINAQSAEALRDSLAAATEILAYYPDSIDLRLKKGAWNIMLEQWEYAKDEYDKVLHLDPNNVAGLYYRAFVNDKQGRYDFARIDYNNLLKIVPSNFEARLGLALLNQKDKHYTEAYDLINILVEQNPDNAVAYAARAGMEKERKMYELAEYDYSKAIELDPKTTDYQINRADVLLVLGEKYKAKTTLDNLVKMGIPRASLKKFYERLNNLR